MWWGSWFRHGATTCKVTGSIPDGVIWDFSLILTLGPHYGPGVDSVSDRNADQKYLQEGKSGRCDISCLFIVRHLLATERLTNKTVNVRYSLTLRRVHVTIVVVETQRDLNITIL